MLPGMKDLRAAHGFLASQDIEQAAEHVWKAVFYRDTWPVELQKRADALIPLLFREGPIKSTVKQLSPADLDNLRVRLEETIGSAEQADRVST
jgi:hypothetical protein